jgi:hypothetical protein
MSKRLLVDEFATGVRQQRNVQVLIFNAIEAGQYADIARRCRLLAECLEDGKKTCLELAVAAEGHSMGHRVLGQN